MDLSIFIESFQDTSYNSFTMTAEMDTTIQDMKAELYRIYRFPVNIQHWIIYGQLRADKDTLKSFNIPDPAEPIKVCVYLANQDEVLNFETMIKVLDRAHIRHGTLEDTILHWKCDQCTTLNEPTRPGCMVCSFDRPNTYKVPDNYVPTPAESRRLGVQA